MTRTSLLARKRGRRVLLADILPQFFAVTAARNEKTRNHYRRAVTWLGEVLGRPARISDLSDDAIRALLSWCLTERKQSAATANTCHKCLCRLWRWLADRNNIATRPTVPRLREPRRTPRAFSMDELRRLVQAAARQPGNICGLPASKWWLMLFALEWDTACRASELLALRWEWLDWERGWLIVPASVRKGQLTDASYGLMPDTLEELSSVRKADGLILQWEMDRSRYWQLWGKLLRDAGLPSDRWHKTHCLRRSFATWLEYGGGNAQQALGHASRSTTILSYIDPTIAARRAGESIPFRLLALKHDSPELPTPGSKK